MGGMEWLLEIVLVLLLAATLFHALRLERALGVLKRDRAALEALVRAFNASTEAAEQGVDRLHAAAEGAGRQISRQVDSATRLKDDLVFLTERGERLADRLDHLVRAARGLDLAEPRAAAPPPRPSAPDGRSPEPPSPAWRFAEPASPEPPPPEPPPPERGLPELVPSPAPSLPDSPWPGSPSRAPASPDPPARLRSQAERDLLRALRLGR